jgi:hypothetical protein
LFLNAPVKRVIRSYGDYIIPRSEEQFLTKPSIPVRVNLAAIYIQMSDPLGLACQLDSGLIRPNPVGRSVDGNGWARPEVLCLVQTVAKNYSYKQNPARNL